jgi:glycosyltransferase involved in cell wall biosynthesis
MIVLMVNKFHYLRGGAERYYFDLSALLERHGHRVIPFSTRDPRNQPTPYAEDFIPGTDFDAAGGPLGALRRAGRVIHSPGARRAMARVLARHRPDLVHLHNVAHHFSPSILDALAAARVPVVQTVHDFKLLCPTYLMLRHGEVCELCAGGNVLHAVVHRCNRGSLARSAVSAIESGLAAARNAYAPVRRFLCPSRFLRGKLVARGIAAERLVHLPLFVDPERLAAANAPPAAPGSRRGVLFVGRLSPEKGVRTLLAAAALARDVPLMIAGEGPLAAELERAVAERHLGHVRLVGRLGGEELAALWRAAAATVVPSECYENFPLVVVESLALGVPVIASRLGGLAELVTESGAGWLVPPRAPAELAAAMQAAVADPERSLALGAAGRAVVAARYTPAEHLAGIRAAYAAAGAIAP